MEPDLVLKTNNNNIKIKETHELTSTWILKITEGLKKNL